MFKVINKEFFDTKMLPEKGKALINLKDAVSNPRPVQFVTVVTNENPLEFKGESDLTVFVDTDKDRNSFSIRKPHPVHGKERNLYLIAAPYNGVIDTVSVPAGVIVRKAFVAKRQGLEPVTFNKKVFSSVLYMLLEAETTNNYVLRWNTYQKSHKKLISTPYTLTIGDKGISLYAGIGQVINPHHTKTPLTENGFVDLKAIRAGKEMVTSKYDDIILVVNNDAKNNAAAQKQTRTQPPRQKNDTSKERNNSNGAKIHAASLYGTLGKQQERTNGKKPQSQLNQAKKQYADRGFGKPVSGTRPSNKNRK